MARARDHRFIAAAAVTAVVAAALVGVGGARRARADDDGETRSQWALAQVGAPQAWARTTGAGVRIGVVDTGVDIAHEDLAGKVVAATGCIGAAGVAARCSGSGQDDNGHGTHVAGIVAAVRGNGAIPVLSAGSPRRLGIGLGSRSDRDLNAVVAGATGADGRMVATSPPTGNARLAVLAPGGSGGADRATDVLSTFWEAGRHDA